MNKRGVSNVIATIIMIAIVMAVAVLVWTVVNNSVSDEIKGTSSCFGIFDKVSLDPAYTCYDSENDELMFFVSVKDIDVDGILVTVSSIGGSVSLNIDDESSDKNSNLRFYNGTLNEWAPPKNTGYTYILTEVTSIPDSIRIAPIMGNKQCSETDQITEIDSCSSLL